MKASMQHKQSSPKASNDIFSRGKHGKNLQDILTGLFKGLPYSLVVCYIERFFKVEKKKLPFVVNANEIQLKLNKMSAVLKRLF